MTGACWGVVLATWIAGALYGARTPRGQRQRTGAAGLWPIGAVIGGVLFYRLTLQDLQRLTDRSLWLEIPGLVLLITSTDFTVWARLRLGRMWSAAPNTLQAHHELRTDGPYAITRHPIYTGLLGMLLGTVLLNGVGVWLGLFIVGAAFLVTRIPIEERMMSHTFPTEYARYRNHVPCLIPRLRLPRASH